MYWGVYFGWMCWKVIYICEGGDFININWMNLLLLKLDWNVNNDSGDVILFKFNLICIIFNLWKFVVLFSIK